MKYLILLVITMMSFSTVANDKFTDAELTDAALIGLINDIADELDANKHDQEILNMVYNRARVVRKQLNKRLEQLEGLDSASDADILAVLQDIHDELLAASHSRKTLEFSRRHLEQSLFKLLENRSVSQEIAVLTLENADPLNFGLIFFGTDSVALVNVTNNGNGQATFLGASSADYGLAEPFRFNEEFNGSTDFSGRLGTCESTLAAGASCSIAIQFAPVAPGTFNDTLEINYFDGVNAQLLTKDLTGSAN